MKQNKISMIGRVLGIALLTRGVVAVDTVWAHCDTMDGPVVTEAIPALDKGDVTPLLKWVTADDEAEIKALFAKTAPVRKRGGDAGELAERLFLETLVRLHRASEGAPFNGIKPAGTPGSPAVAKADESLAKGSVDELAKGIAGTVEKSIRDKFAATLEARKHKDTSVGAGRKFVDDYVEFVHYVKGIHDILTKHGACDGK